MSTSAPDEPGPAPEFDSRAVLADIERDVRERRRSGQITPDFEATLAGAFAEVAPNGSVGGGFDEVVAQAARHAVVDYDAPITGSKPLQLVKRAVKVLTAWYMIFVGRQLVAFAGTTLRALRLMGSRVDHLEARVPSMDTRLSGLVAPTVADGVRSWQETVIRELTMRDAPAGRVVHGDCGTGDLLVALHTAGIDCYGVDARADSGVVADAHGLTVRGDDTLAHLRSVARGSLSAVVLSGCVDRYELGDQVELVTMAARALVDDGTMLLIGRDPRVHFTATDATQALTADLAPGRPLRPATWEHLLEHAGFSVTGIALEASVDGVNAAQHPDPLVQRLADAVLVPESFCITARRQ